MELVKRKKARLNSYNYSQDGYYFITICTHNKKHILCEIKKGKPYLSKYGHIIKEQIIKLNNIYDNVSLDKYVIMPNHIHLILKLNGYNCENSEQNNERFKMTLSKIIQQFKSAVTKKCKDIDYYVPMQWQRSFYDHVIRDDTSYLEICEYIENNPLKWDLDEYY